MTISRGVVEAKELGLNNDGAEAVNLVNEIQVLTQGGRTGHPTLAWLGGKKGN